MSRTEIKITGMDEVRKNLAALTKLYPEAAKRALNFRAELIMTDSKEHYVPVDEGELRASGHVVPDKDKIKVTLGFGGPAGIGNRGESNKDAVGYAVIQHEVKTFKHTVGESEYLKKPVMAAVPNLAKDIGGDIKAEVESGLR